MFNAIYFAFLKNKDSGFFNLKKNISSVFYDEIISPFYWVYNKILLKYKIDCNCLTIVDEGIEAYADVDRLFYTKLENKKIDIYLLNMQLLSSINGLPSNIRVYAINIDVYFLPLKELANNLIIKDNAVIFLSTTTWVSSEKEAYSNEDIFIIKQLISLGYNVYYRAHPRNYLKKLDSLYKIINSDKFFIMDVSNNPLCEAVLFNNKNKIRFIVGDSSSTLFYSYKIFGIPSFSVLKNKYELHRLKMFRYLPDFKDFLKSELSPIDFYNKSLDCLNFVGKKFDIIYDKALKSRIIKEKVRKKIKKTAVFLLILIVIITLVSFTAFIL